MIEKLVSSDAFLNYFAEFLGIVITVILIPIVLKRYEKQKNKHKKYLAEKILMKTIFDGLEKIVPTKFRDFENSTLWVDGKAFKKGITVFSFMLPFTLKKSAIDDIEKYYIRKLSTSSNDLTNVLTKLHSEIKDTRNALSNFFGVYGDVMDKRTLREYYIMDYNIQTTEDCFAKYQKDDIEIYSETIKIVIFTLEKMSKILLEKHKELSREEIKFDENAWL